MRTEGSDQTDLIVQNGCRKIFRFTLDNIGYIHILIIGYNQCYQGSTMPNFDVEFFEKVRRYISGRGIHTFPRCENAGETFSLTGTLGGKWK